jgi:hypothetical protein
MQHHQATALADTPPAATPASAPSQPHVDAPGPAMPVAVEFFLDPVSGWACWISRWPTDAEPGAEDGSLDGRRRQPGQGIAVRLLGRVGAWFGICEQTPPGAWQRVHVPRRDPWEPGACPSRTLWSWWC